MTIKLEVGEKYELNNGEVRECTRMYGDDPNEVSAQGFGPFVLEHSLHHIDGRHGNNGPDMEFSVKRHIPKEQPEPQKNPAHKTGGPAFPPHHDPKTHDSGMTLRDYFAGQALSGWIAGADDDRFLDPPTYAKISYEMADAMIEERSKQ